MLSQRICRSIPCGSVWGREVVMVCRLLLQTCRLPSTPLLRSTTHPNRKCSSFEFFQNTPTRGSQGWEIATKNILLGSQTLTCRRRQFDSASPWTHTQSLHPVSAKTVSLFGKMAPCHETSERSNCSNSSDYHLNMVLGKTVRTSLVDILCLHREQLEENTSPDVGTPDQPLGEW